MNDVRWTVMCVVVAVAFVLSAIGGVGAEGSSSVAKPQAAGGESQVVGGESQAAAVRVANVVYGDGQHSMCFSNGYLNLLARETTIRIHRTPDLVELDSDDLFRYPFAVMSGEGSFHLTDDQFDRLRLYLERGGFLLASAGCSNAAWNRSFREMIAQVFPEYELEELALDDEMFQTVFRITELSTRTHRTDARLYGLRLDGRWALIYSPEGLNDTGNAGGGCCCCGGNEIRNARYVNANVLAYVLMN